MKGLRDFKTELEATCLIIGAITRTRCTISVFPESPQPGDKVGISVGLPSNGETSQGANWQVQSDDGPIPVKASYFEFDLVALLDTARRLDVFTVLQTEIVTGFFLRNPDYEAWLADQRAREED
ncbi:MAG: hypothetical protein ACOCX3_02335 [Chloroflexota bacterium]